MRLKSRPRALEELASVEAEVRVGWAKVEAEAAEVEVEVVAVDRVDSAHQSILPRRRSNHCS